MVPARFAMRRPVTVIMAFVSLIAIGLISGRLLPMEYFPTLDVPYVVIIIPYPGSTPEEIEREITRPIEEVLATLSGIKRIQSTSGDSNAQIEMEFDWGADVAVKAVEARERVEAIRDQLPADIRRINVYKFNTADMAMMTLRISSERDLSNAYDMLMQKLIRPIERLPGVARVELQGLEPREIRIELIADRVVSHSIDLNDLQRRLQALNFSASAGLIEAGQRRYRVSPRGEFRDVDEIARIIITDGGLRLGDIAEVKYEAARRNYARHLDQKYAVGVEVYRENGSNLVDVGERVLQKVNEIGESPEMQGINLFMLQDQAGGVTSSLSELLKAGLFGAFLSLIVLYFFLRNIATTLMVALAVPVSITITLGAMYFAGLSLNILSMMGLMLAVGMLVDNAVVVSESIFTEREKNPGNAEEATVKGVRSVGLAVAAGTLTSAAVFLPIIFGEKNELEIFLTHVAMAIVVSLTISLTIAQTVIPLIASKVKPPQTRDSRGLVERLRAWYGRILAFTVHHQWKSTGVVFLVLFSAAIPITLVETDMGGGNTGRSLFLRYNLDSAYPLSKVKESVDRIEDYLYANQEEFEIKSVYTFYNENGAAQSSILLTDNDVAEKRSIDIRESILAGLPKIAIGSPSFERQEGGSDSVSLNLTGDSTQVLIGIGEEVKRVLQTIEGFEGVRTSRGTGEQEIQVRVNRARANQLGFSTREVAQVVSVALRGINLREYRADDEEVPVRLQFQDSDKANKSNLRELKIRNANGEMVPLMAMVDLVEQAGPSGIRRINRETALRVTANLHDITTESARVQIEENLNLLELPTGYRWSFGSDFNEDEEEMQAMLFNILLAIAIIYLVLAAQFESLLYPASIIWSILFSVVGVYWFFLVTGTDFSLMAMIGILILIGVVVNNGIVLIDHINQLRLSGMPRDEAIIQAGTDRLRPILMTVGTTVLGLLPLCIGNTQIGGDGPPYYPMARAIVGGLMFSTVVSLVFLPTIYIWLDRMPDFSRRMAKKSARPFIWAWNRMLPGRRRAEV